MYTDNENIITEAELKAPNYQKLLIVIYTNIFVLSVALYESHTMWN